MVLTRIDGDLPSGLPRATPDQLRAWIYRDDWSKSTRAAYYGCAAAFFVWATDPWEPRLPANPMRSLPRPQMPRGLPRPITDVQLRDLLGGVEGRIRTWSLLAAYEGLRCCEIAGLRREDVGPDSLRIVGKGDKEAVLPTHPLVWDAVRRLPDGPVARSRAGDPVDAHYVSHTAIVHFAVAGARGVTLHRLRHWFGTTVYRQTRDLRRTQELLRHASPTTTAVYTLVSDEEREMAIRALPTFTAP
jgi:integrase/recombinase XerC